MKLSNFLEVFFILACGLAMPFIVIGSYFIYFTFNCYKITDKQ